MALSVLQSTGVASTGGGGNGVFASGSNKAMTFGSSTTSGGLLVVIATMYDSSFASDPSVSDNKGNTFTLLMNYESSEHRIAVWYCNNFTGGATHTVTMSGSTNAYGVFSAIEIAGAATSDVVDSGATSTSTTTTPASATQGSFTSPTLSQAEEIVFAMHVVNSSEADDGTPAGPSSPWNTVYMRKNYVADHTGLCSYQITSATDAVTATFTYGTTIDTPADVLNATVAFKALVEATDATATLESTLDSVTPSSAVDVDVSASLTSTLAAVTPSSAVDVVAAVIATLQSVSTTTAVDVDLESSTDSTLDSVTLTSSSIVDVIAEATKTLDDITISSSGQVSNIAIATLSSTLSDVTLSSDVLVSDGIVILCELSSTLADATSSATAFVKDILPRTRTTTASVSQSGTTKARRRTVSITINRYGSTSNTRAK